MNEKELTEFLQWLFEHQWLVSAYEHDHHYTWTELATAKEGMQQIAKRYLESKEKEQGRVLFFSLEMESKEKEA